MAQKYMLVPLPIGLFAGYDLTTRAVLGALYDRYRLSSYNVTGTAGDSIWYDYRRDEVFCIYTHEELARQIGCSEKTIRRALNVLREDGLIDWRKATYKGANRYYLHECIRQELKKQ